MAGASPTDPLDPPIILRSNGDFLKAQATSEQLLTAPFRKIDSGRALDDSDRKQLLQGARLCSAMAAYLPGQAEGQDFKCGEALSALGYHEEAIRRYKLVIDAIGAHPPTDTLAVVRADAYALMSRSMTATKDYRGALDAVEESLKAYPGTAVYLNDRANAEIALGRLDAAKADLKAAIAGSSPDDPAKQRAEALLKKLTSR